MCYVIVAPACVHLHIEDQPGVARGEQVIDLRCGPFTPLLMHETKFKELQVSSGCQVSVDTFLPDSSEGYELAWRQEATRGSD